MRVILLILAGALSPAVFADLVIESDCDVDTTTETVAINIPDAL